MATTITKKTAPAAEQLKARLISLRLKKLSVEIICAPEEAGKGKLVLAYNISTAPGDKPNSRAALLSVTGQGVNKEDASKVAFTIDAEMLGSFELTRKSKKSEESEVAITMANFIAPALSNMIETTLTRGGYPRTQIPISFPENN